ncbi:MAG: hypothetical protein MUC87_10930 [Bacteroidia bacterium]|jgi:hypothetical protein|nr:hypothetical protein [Bacteroidia bacterium]
MNLIRVVIAALCIVGAVSVFLPWTSISFEGDGFVGSFLKNDYVQKTYDDINEISGMEALPPREGTSFKMSTTKGFNGMGKLTLVLFVLTAILAFLGDVHKETFDKSWNWIMSLSAGNFGLTLIFTMLTPDLNTGFANIHLTYEFGYWLALTCALLAAGLVAYSKSASQNIFRNKFFPTSKTAKPAQGE